LRRFWRDRIGRASSIGITTSSAGGVHGHPKIGSSHVLISMLLIKVMALVSLLSGH
jgi:hypothetical protein